ncbi:MAG: hypothetical protein QOK43_103 [Acidimicrobiaceae bacterium]|jgi:hypothetical protein|nr:hypothetical protein [Acidimicrobiaceae bacterium]
MKHGSWKPRHVVALAALGAAAIIGAPVAVGAATGQLVNIADGTTSTQIAKVDRFGQLKTDGSPLRPFVVADRSVPNYYPNGVYQRVEGPTSATLALSHISFSTSIYAEHVWEAFVYQVAGTTDAECHSNQFSTKSILIGYFKIAPSGTHERDLATPIVLKPFPGVSSWCLLVGAGDTASSPNDTASLLMDYSGYIVSGTYPPPAAAAAAAASSSSASPSAAPGAKGLAPLGTPVPAG